MWELFVFSTVFYVNLKRLLKIYQIFNNLTALFQKITLPTNVQK